MATSTIVTAFLFLTLPLAAVASPGIQVSITSGPSGTTDQTTASLTFEANERGATFRCSLDGSPPATCSSPVEYSGLADGDHLFTVQARDATGRNVARASRRWTVQTVAPPPPEPKPSPLLPVGGERAKLRLRGSVVLGPSGCARSRSASPHGATGRTRSSTTSRPCRRPAAPASPA